jgi:amidase
MNRKEFLTNTTLAAAGLTSLLIESCKNAPSEIQSVVTTTISEDNFELNETTISELQEKMASGQYSAVQLTTLYLRRIEAIDKKGHLRI